MNNPDIVDCLELARTQWAMMGHTGERDLCGNAKDEILALRAQLATARDAAIEECAIELENHDFTHSLLPILIRGLKGKS